MSGLRILYLCHNHPALHAGGTEIFARNLFREIVGRGAAEALFVGCTDRLHREPRPGTLFQTVGRSSNEFLLWTGHFDRFNMSQLDTHGVVPALSELLLSFRPDIVHFHHGMLIGMEMLALVKRLLPTSRLVFTLHDYYAICANDGQMVTTPAAGGRRCRAASLDGCVKCFPAIDPDRFTLREHFIRSMLDQADRLVSPSQFLKHRFVEWGIAPDRIDVVPNGQPARTPAPHRPAGGKRNRFGFFGHLNPYKGGLVALKAAELLTKRGQTGFSLTLHGGADYQSEAFRAELKSALDRAGPSVRSLGSYDEADLPALMEAVDWVVVPSIWWENAPLVIQEAFLHRRPVICSGIGGMAEAVTDGVNGLHVPPSDAEALADTMAAAVSDPLLWDRLVAGIRPPVTIAESATAHLELYHDLLDCAELPVTKQAARKTGGARDARRQATDVMQAEAS